ncbi:hypothetical protein [Micromonospora sp. NPDC049679]|uniref:hypothetical protein n=1 Tax=Micromonospora sp. NPDC049679 TaxID=3155920 RepID=UPI0033FE49A1
MIKLVVHPQSLDRPAGSDPLSSLSDLVGDRAAGFVAVALQQAHQPDDAADWWLRAERPMLRSELAAHLTDLARAGLSGVTPQEEK